MLTKRCGVCGEFADKPGKVHRHKGRKVYRWTHTDKMSLLIRHHDFKITKAMEVK